MSFQLRIPLDEPAPDPGLCTNYAKLMPLSSRLPFHFEARQFQNRQSTNRTSRLLFIRSALPHSKGVYHASCGQHIELNDSSVRLVRRHLGTMRILWICPFFLHPTDRGAQIRTLGTLRELHRRHEIHFAALNDPRNLEGPRRSSEYSSHHLAVEHKAPARGSAGIIPQLMSSIVNPVPIAVSRYSSRMLKQKIDALIATGRYDSIVCDFLAATPNLTDLKHCLLFQHNVETIIWQRHAEQSRSRIKKLFFQTQATKMEAYERKICRTVRHVIAVSEIDVARMKSMFGIETVTSVSTGVDVEYFAPRGCSPQVSDMVFCGSMDWLPNGDAVVYFLSEVLPLIRDKLPRATLTIVGRSPDTKVLKSVETLAGVSVTGKVEDVRPYLWGAKISIVPIRIGGGTRLKVYECMAAGVPVVSTSVGAEGLRFKDGFDIVLADDPGSFAAACVRLLANDAIRCTMASNALDRARREFSWKAVGLEFEAILEHHRQLPAEVM
jgi:polysaccharide biosynthesis protein PslH